MAIIFLAECGSKRQAERFCQYFDAFSWPLMDDLDIVATCRAVISQDLEENWWCSLSVDVLDWKPVNGAEKNYRLLQITGMQSCLAQRLETAPDFRYALAGEISEEDQQKLLTHRDYGITFNCLMEDKSENNPFRLPLAVTNLGVDFYLSKSVWVALRSPDTFKPSPIKQYVWIPAASQILTGGIVKPPKVVMTGDQRRIVIDSKAADAYISKAISLCGQGRYAEALEAAEQAQQLNPISPTVHQNKAACLFYLRRYAAAIQHCNNVIKLNPHPDILVVVYQLLGDCLFYEGRFEEALASHQKSIDLNPDAKYMVHPHCQKAALLLNLGRLPAALEACDVALKLAPQSEQLRSMRSEILADLNKN